MSQDEGMFESPVETLEKAIGLRLIWTGGNHITLTLREAHGIPLQAVQGIRVSSHGEGEVSWVFSICRGLWGIFQVTVGMLIGNSCLFSEVRSPV